MQPCKRRVRSPPGSPPAQGRSPPEQAQSEKSQGVRGTESPDSSINTKENRELRVRFFGGTTVSSSTDECFPKACDDFQVFFPIFNLGIEDRTDQGILTHVSVE